MTDATLTDVPARPASTARPLGFNPAAALALRARLSGAVFGPGDAVYEGMCRVWNASASSPALIVRARDGRAFEVALAFARTQGLPVAVRSGPRGPIEYGPVHGRLVIDLSGAPDLTAEEAAGLLRAHDRAARRDGPDATA